jgi:hypothetical protein
LQSCKLFLIFNIHFLSPCSSFSKLYEPFSFFLFLSLSLSPSVISFLFLFITLSHYSLLPLSFTVSVSLTYFLSLSLFRTISNFFTLSFFLFLGFRLSNSLSLYLFLSCNISIFNSLFLSRSLSLSLFTSFLTFSLSFSISRCLSFPHLIYYSIISLSFFLLKTFQVTNKSQIGLPCSYLTSYHHSALNINNLAHHN